MTKKYQKPVLKVTKIKKVTEKTDTTIRCDGRWCC